MATWLRFSLRLKGACSVLVGLAAVMTAAPSTAVEPASAAKVTVVFWTAGDCTYCTQWKRGGRYDEFAAEAARLGATMATVAKPALRDPATAFRWDPSVAAAPPTRLADLAPPKLLPSFDVLCNGQPVKRLMGLAEWDSFWRSQLRRTARECTSIPS